MTRLSSRLAHRAAPMLVGGLLLAWRPAARASDPTEAVAETDVEAQAQVPRGPQLRIGLELEPIGFAWTPRNETISTASVGSFGVGLGRGSLLGRVARTPKGGGNVTFAGLPFASFHIGGTLLEDRMVIGGRLGFGYHRRWEAEDDGGGYDPLSLLIVECVPYLAWLFGEGKVRPFVEGRAGLIYANWTLAARSVTPKRNEGLIAPTLGVGGGAMFFAAPRISIDLGLGLDYVAVRSIYPQGAVDSQGAFRHGFAGGFRLGFSIWAPRRR